MASLDITATVIGWLVITWPSLDLYVPRAAYDRAIVAPRDTIACEFS